MFCPLGNRSNHGHIVRSRIWEYKIMKTKQRLLSPGLTLACLILPLCAATSGCFIPIPIPGYVDSVCVSPDGQRVAYNSTDAIVILPWRLETNWLCWQDSPGQWFPGKVRLNSGSCIIGPCGEVGLGPRSVVFSPDSARIALITAEGLFVVDLKTHKITKLLDDNNFGMRKLTWLGNDELGYFRHDGDTDDPDPKTSTITAYRHGTNQGDQPQIAYHKKDAADWSASWSADRRYLTIPNRARDALDIVELKTGKVIWTDRMSKGRFNGAVWTPDSSAAAYIFRAAAPTKNAPEAYVAHISVLDLAAKKVRRFKQEYTNTEKWSHQDYDPYLQWTADRKHLLVGANALLLDIQTGAFTSMRDLLIKHFKLQGIEREYWYGVYPFPKPGWLWLKGPDRKTYALDYKSKRFVYISSAEEIIPCPGGERIIEIKSDINVSIRKTPALPPLDKSE